MDTLNMRDLSQIADLVASPIYRVEEQLRHNLAREERKLAGVIETLQYVDTRIDMGLGNINGTLESIDEHLVELVDSHKAQTSAMQDIAAALAALVDIAKR